MPRPPEAAPSPGPDPDDLTFEQCYERLQEVVREMESDDLPLTGLIAAYERGIRLHGLCQKRLEEAQGRIEIIRRRASGETVAEPFDDAAEADAAPSASSPGAPAPVSLKKDAELF